MPHMPPIQQMQKSVRLEPDGSFSLMLEEPRAIPDPIIFIEEDTEPKVKPIPVEKPKPPEKHKILEYAEGIAAFFEENKDQFKETTRTYIPMQKISFEDSMITIKAILRDKGKEMGAERQRAFVKSVLGHVDPVEIYNKLHPECEKT